MPSCRLLTQLTSQTPFPSLPAAAPVENRLTLFRYHCHSFPYVEQRQLNPCSRILGRFTMFGLATGVLAATGAAMLVRSFIFGIRAIDPITFLAVPLLLLAVSGLAAYLPARRAAMIDPVEALRVE